MTVAYDPNNYLLADKGGLNARLYPNGEIVIWKPTQQSRHKLKRFFEDEYTGGWKSMWNVALMKLGILPPQASPLGLSTQKNFDKLGERVVEGEGSDRHVVTRYGANGITSYGARRVRNCCYELQRRAPKKCVCFATVTVPTMPFEMMARLHESWNKVVDAYRRKLRRKLRNNGLSGDSVTVSEIQSKRYKSTGIPILHLHTVFVGRVPGKKWAISTEDHDQIWKETLSIVLGEGVPEVSSACNIQSIKKSAEGYLGKYMTKGTKVVRQLAEEGFIGWLPKQWWAASRSLCKIVDNETRLVPKFAEWLNYVADIERRDVWAWHKCVPVKFLSGDTVIMARIGRLTPPFNRWFHDAILA